MVAILNKIVHFRAVSRYFSMMHAGHDEGSMPVIASGSTRAAG